MCSLVSFELNLNWFGEIGLKKLEKSKDVDV